jgi:RNA polymerase sigma-70 factor (ECF subfamily)
MGAGILAPADARGSLALRNGAAFARSAAESCNLAGRQRGREARDAVSDSFAMPSNARPADDPPPTLEVRLSAEAPALRAFLRRIAGESAARQHVDDLAQETLARALRYRGAFDQRRPVGAWLRGVALRVLIDHRARHARAPEMLDAEVHEPHAPAVDALEQRDELESLLALLAKVERDVLVRFHSGGQSIEEIASALAMPVGTVKSHLHRARRKLAERGRDPRGAK